MMENPKKSNPAKIGFIIGWILLLIALAIIVSYYVSIKFNQCTLDPLDYAEQLVLETTNAEPGDVQVTLLIKGKYFIFEKGVLTRMPEINSFSFNP